VYAESSFGAEGSFQSASRSEGGVRCFKPSLASNGIRDTLARVFRPGDFLAHIFSSSKSDVIGRMPEPSASAQTEIFVRVIVP
jgi:hypothetical protein